MIRRWNFDSCLESRPDRPDLASAEGGWPNDDAGAPVRRRARRSKSPKSGIQLCCLFGPLIHIQTHLERFSSILNVTFLQALPLLLPETPWASALQQLAAWPLWVWPPAAPGSRGRLRRDRQAGGQEVKEPRWPIRVRHLATSSFSLLVIMPLLLAAMPLCQVTCLISTSGLMPAVSVDEEHFSASRS